MEKLSVRNKIEAAKARRTRLEDFTARLTAQYVSEALARGDEEPRRRVLESLKLREAAWAKAAKHTTKAS
jgi:hypothetical protein